MPKIKMLRSLPLKPDADEGDQRYEGQVYTVDKKEAVDLLGKGLAVDVADQDAKALVVDEKGNRRLVPAAEVPVPPPPPPADGSAPPVPPVPPPPASTKK